MPEGHTLHRLARQQQALFAGQVMSASSPQGRFAGGAAMIDGLRLDRVDAYGKHLLQHYENDLILHVHLGLYGKFTTGADEPPEPRGALRLRLSTVSAWTDLRGPTACELLEEPALETLLARLGPDPLRGDADPDRAFRRISRSRAPIAALLMDQSVVAAIGNVYRAELPFRHRIDPLRPGREVTRGEWEEMWSDLVVLMRYGVRTGRIVTIRPEDRVSKRGAPSRANAGYVYRRTGLPCRVCGSPVAHAVLVARNLFWCPTCQAE